MRKIDAFFRKIIFHPDPVKRTLVTLIYCGIGIYFNFFVLQVFCRPVPYAAAMCVAFFLSILVFPFVNSGWLKGFLYFFIGTGVPICVYCMLFLGGPLLIGYIGFALLILFFGGGLLAFIPFYLLAHIRRYYKTAGRTYRIVFKSGIFIPLVVLAVYLFNFKAYLSVADKMHNRSVSKDEIISALPSNYFTERLLGLCWKYHTNLEFINDGWRPPLHDPFLVIAISVFNFPFHSTDAKWPNYNTEAIKYYHRKFPERPLKESCPCSYSHDGVGYLSDPLDSVEVKH